MKPASRTVLFVDPLSSGTRYGVEAKNYGLKPLALLTRRQFPEQIAHLIEISGFDEVLYLDNFESTLAILREKQVQAILPGGQPALIWVDLLSEALGLIGNPTQSLETRIDKALMKKTLKASNLKCADYLLCNDIEIASRWIEERGYPVVIKPNHGVGSVQVKIVTNRNELSSAIDGIRALDKLLCGREGDFLIEEFLEGEEYFMNLLSNGASPRKLVSFARYEKLQVAGFASIYRNIFSLPLNDDLAKETLGYVNNVNSALQVNYGISDVELKITEKGPAFIELNNRLPGADVPYLIQKCSGFNCYYENMNAFLGENISEQEVSFHRHYCICCLINPDEGTVISIDGLDEIQHLSSFDSLKIKASKGNFLPKTVDLTTPAGFVFLIHADPAVLREHAEVVHSTVKIRTLK